ncbi:MAG: hypothetical protein NXH75_05845 [Halobacteriovoraceae bacterium]|nr:hypothetical protein [Halobacteriovoraceae bacterium]
MEIKVIVSMDWEGTSLEAKNLEAIQEFKERWNVPMVHFFNPAYYTHPDFTREQVNSFVKKTFKPEDEVALHLHTPQHFLKQAGVSPRFSPCFSRLGDYNAGAMNGQEVMLLAYQKDEVKKLIEASLKVFRENGIEQIHSFRAGGWMADERVWEALSEVGIPIESSAGNWEFLKGSSWEGDNLDRYSQILWGERGKSIHPYSLESFSGQLFEIPNNLGAIDYWSEGNFYHVFDNLMPNLEGNSTVASPVFVINSHQETAAEHFPKLYEFLAYLHGAYGDRLKFVTNKEIYFEEIYASSVSERHQLEKVSDRRA